MARTSSFAFTNVTASTKTVAPTEIKVVTNYGEIPADDNTAMLSNTTCPLDQPEIISYSHKFMKKVDSKATVQNPARVTDAIQYQIRVDDILRTSGDGEPEVDNPIVAYLTIRHELSGNITAAQVETVVNRLLGACRTSAGAWRFGDMMRGMLKPVQD